SGDYMENVLPWNQILAFQNFKKFRGYLGNLFELNPSIDSYFKNLQVSMGYMPQLEGREWAKTFVSISNIATLLTALTAFKVGRHDLIRAPGAFRKLNI
ncbi:MAG: hypothetical protein QM426_04995, partial [Euryarchaeota archaeon]|nr:hypothetical protein [Euryarchaeota archaeon]